ncbi:hypothetical protein M8A51_05780 [Schlegelella sp. S2-27]|uniref:Lipoprotein n=1 Tax=Caldimonas mangrovi TaxID=2944811 RepID=A0ABT0YJY0_9BURK|nr:hypothetical protein [Caldimonas mangrovi]MCM5679040.1 hypothetical protein [Caldimonas mangrovi]
MQVVRLARLGMAAAVVTLLAACAHPINLEPSMLPERTESQLVKKKVGYVITDADRAKEVTTPGGGGDKVSYFPYRDMEKAVRSALRAVYEEVSSVKAGSDATALREAGISYVFTPEIITNSSSPSPFTWPPTKFSAEVSCTVTDAAGTVVARVRATGNGAAEFEEFKSDFSLSARRAVADVAEKLVAEIRKSEQLR